MSRIFTEQWERRKWYLIRSLFVEEPKLSPIPERQELLLEPQSPSDVIINRPVSPLPSLIIEKEPNRYDEPEEFYQELEREVIKLYRKLFLDSENSSERSLDSDEMYSISQFIDLRGCDSKDTRESSSEKSSFAKEEQSHEEISNEIQNTTKLTDISMEGSTTSESRNNEIIVTEAQVHQGDGEESIIESRLASIGSSENESSEIENNNVNVSSPTDIEENEEQCEDEQMQTDSEDLSLSNSGPQTIVYASTYEDPKLMTACVTDASASPEEPDVMRRQETSNDSVQSINALDVGRYFSGNFSGDKRFEFNYVRAMEEAEISSPESSVISVILQTTKSKRTVRNGDRKRRIPSEINSHQSRSSLIKKKFENIATQTSFSSSDDEENWREVLEHCFNGNSRIFKLCSCRNHNCY